MELAKVNQPCVNACWQTGGKDLLMARFIF